MSQLGPPAIPDDRPMKPSQWPQPKAPWWHPSRVPPVAKRFGLVRITTSWPHHDQKVARSAHFARLRRGR